VLTLDKALGHRHKKGLKIYAFALLRIAQDRCHRLQKMAERGFAEAKDLLHKGALFSDRFAALVQKLAVAACLDMEDLIGSGWVDVETHALDELCRLDSTLKALVVIHDEKLARLHGMGAIPDAVSFQALDGHFDRETRVILILGKRVYKRMENLIPEIEPEVLQRAVNGADGDWSAQR
jgi:hypothetical protein